MNALLFSFAPIRKDTSSIIFKRRLRYYFCVMTRLVVFLVLAFCTSSLLAQVRVGKLVIKPNETYELGQSDILVADTLIMMDSSRLLLNKLKRDNFIRAKVVVFGNYCVIDGKGVSGQPGRNG